MTTATKAKTKAKAKPQAEIDTFDWTATEHGRFRIEKTRFGLFTSYDPEGNALITGPTEQAVLAVTPMHLHSQTPDGKGLYSVSSKAVSVGVDL